MQCLFIVTAMSFNWLLCKLPNAISVIKHAYTTLMMSWKFFHYSPKRAVIKGDSESTRSPGAQNCELSDLRRLAHERCVKAVNASYSSIVLALVTPQ